MCNTHYHNKCRKLVQTIACTKQQDLRFSLECYKEHGSPILVPLDSCKKHTNLPCAIDLEELPIDAPVNVQDQPTNETIAEQIRYIILLYQSIIEELENNDGLLLQLADLVAYSITSNERWDYWVALGKDAFLREGPQRVKDRCNCYKKKLEEKSCNWASLFAETISKDKRRKVVGPNQIFHIETVLQLYTQPKSEANDKTPGDDKSIRSVAYAIAEPTSHQADDNRGSNTTKAIQNPVGEGPTYGVQSSYLAEDDHKLYTTKAIDTTLKVQRSFLVDNYLESNNTKAIQNPVGGGTTYGDLADDDHKLYTTKAIDTTREVQRSFLVDNCLGSNTTKAIQNPVGGGTTYGDLADDDHKLYTTKAIDTTSEVQRSFLVDNCLGSNTTKAIQNPGEDTTYGVQTSYQTYSKPNLLRSQRRANTLPRKTNSRRKRSKLYQCQGNISEQVSVSYQEEKGDVWYCFKNKFGEQYMLERNAWERYETSGKEGFAVKDRLTTYWTLSLGDNGDSQ